jgi:ubiquinol-cytochrome c reductase cytochrome b subunit
MRKLVGRAGDWLEDRTGLRSAISGFFLEKIPVSAGWPQVFGSVALFLFLIQAFTGILLALNYAATPVDAYSSVHYIQTKVAGGRMVRGLHHWGASAMIIVVCMHMAQVFIFRAYRKPREATWIAGVFLLLITFTFGLTGYLLPWDNKAFWGTMVTTRIVSGVPLAGDVVARLLGAADGIGVVTFSRFYALHTLVLPVSATALIVFHVYLVRRHGVTPAPSETEITQRFYPGQLFRDVIAIFAAFVGLFLAAAFLDVPLERMADPTDTAYVPRPEWYFLFLFQLLKVFPGRLELIGTVVLPTLTILLLILLPFLPHPRINWLGPRLQAGLLVVLGLAVWGGLTGAAWFGTPHSSGQSGAVLNPGVSGRMAPEKVAGVGYFRSLQCVSCHNLVSGSPKPGPDLGLIGLRHTKEWITKHIDDSSPRSSMAGSAHREVEQAKIDAIVLLLSNPDPESISKLNDASPRYIDGAQIYVEKACGSCHQVNGEGGSMGPSLNGLGNRRNADWVRLHFVAPRRLSPGSIMPPYHFQRSEEAGLVAYLLSL